jgi:hypothetical protein
MLISWIHQDTGLKWPLSTETKIDIFYHQTLGWQLHVADLLSNGGEELGNARKVESINHSGFAVLQICLSYFETIGKCRALASGSRANFRAGAQDVFPELGKVPQKVREDLLNILYGDARCALYHNSRTRGVGLGQPPNDEAIAYDPLQQKLIINPHRLPKVLKSHLERYRTELLDSNNVLLRQHFEEWFDKDFGHK